MIKKLLELDRAEKQLLLQGIISGEVGPDNLSEKTLIGFESSDFFLSLIIGADNPEVSFIYLADSLKAKADFYTKWITAPSSTESPGPGSGAVQP